MNNEKPYLTEIITQEIKKYNPNYGDDRLCECGHTYYRHFDTWENMENVGCKYCLCYDFQEAIITPEKITEIEKLLRKEENNYFIELENDFKNGKIDEKRYHEYLLELKFRSNW